MIKFALSAALLFVPFAQFASAEESAAGHGHSNHLGLFVGATSVEHETEPSVGLEYEYLVSSIGHGLILIAERTFAETPFTLLLAGANLHFLDHGRFVLAFGQESAHGHSENVIRAGLGWEFHAGAISITPSVAYDKIGADHHATVAGVAFGIGF